MTIIGGVDNVGVDEGGRDQSFTPVGNTSLTAYRVEDKSVRSAGEGTDLHEPSDPWVHGLHSRVKIFELVDISKAEVFCGDQLPPMGEGEEVKG